MSAQNTCPGPKGPVARFRSDDSGATMVEFAIVLPILLLLFFGLIDFGRLAFHIVASERAMSVAARVAAVRPPACDGLPETHQRDPDAEALPEFGTNCNAGGKICRDIGTISCTGRATNATATEIWALVRGTLPNDATISQMRFSYAYDADLGFLGGPYVPVVTVELENVGFEFVSPLTALAELAGATLAGNLDNDITLPRASVSLPGEDLAMGGNG